MDILVTLKRHPSLRGPQGVLKLVSSTRVISGVSMSFLVLVFLNFHAQSTNSWRLWAFPTKRQNCEIGTSIFLDYFRGPSDDLAIYHYLLQPLVVGFGESMG